MIRSAWTKSLHRKPRGAMKTRLAETSLYRRHVLNRPDGKTQHDFLGRSITNQVNVDTSSLLHTQAHSHQTFSRRANFNMFISKPIIAALFLSGHVSSASTLAPRAKLGVSCQTSDVSPSTDDVTRIINQISGRTGHGACACRNSLGSRELKTSGKAGVNLTGLLPGLPLLLSAWS